MEYIPGEIIDPRDYESIFTPGVIYFDMDGDLAECVRCEADHTVFQVVECRCLGTANHYKGRLFNIWYDVDYSPFRHVLPVIDEIPL